MGQPAAGHGNNHRVIAGKKDVDPHDLEERDPERGLPHLAPAAGDRAKPAGRIHHLPNRTHRKFLLFNQPTISLPAKNCMISFAAVSGASEPCTEFSPIDLAYTFLILPGAALAGSVAPMMSRCLWIAFS